MGAPVQTNEWLAIYNVKAGECLVQFDRTAGADIGWPSSRTWREQLQEDLAKAAVRHLKKAYDELMGK